MASSHVAKGITSAAASMGLHFDKNRLWADDLIQAARIALWLKPPVSVGEAYGVARRAMIDELRRLKPLSRSESPPVWICLDDEPEQTGGFMPDQLLEAKQLLALLQDTHPGWAVAFAESDSLREAGARMGVGESMACYVRQAMKARASDCSALSG